MVAVAVAVAAEAAGIARAPRIPTETAIVAEAAGAASTEAVLVNWPKPLWLPLESAMPLISTSRAGIARRKRENGQSTTMTRTLHRTLRTFHTRRRPCHRHSRESILTIPTPTTSLHLLALHQLPLLPPRHTIRPITLLHQAQSLQRNLTVIPPSQDRTGTHPGPGGRTRMCRETSVTAENTASADPPRSRTRSQPTPSAQVCCL